MILPLPLGRVYTDGQYVRIIGRERSRELVVQNGLCYEVSEDERLLNVLQERVIHGLLSPVVCSFGLR